MCRDSGALHRSNLDLIGESLGDGNGWHRTGNRREREIWQVGFDRWAIRPKFIESCENNDGIWQFCPESQKRFAKSVCRTWRSVVVESRVRRWHSSHESFGWRRDERCRKEGCYWVLDSKCRIRKLNQLNRGALSLPGCPGELFCKKPCF